MLFDVPGPESVEDAQEPVEDLSLVTNEECVHAMDELEDWRQMLSWFVELGVACRVGSDVEPDLQDEALPVAYVHGKGELHEPVMVNIWEEGDVGLPVFTELAGEGEDVSRFVD